MWYNGSIYPTDPQTRQCQTFNALQEVLEFVGDSEDGTFGIPSILERSISDESCRYIIQIVLLNKCITNLKKENDIHWEKTHAIPKLEEESMSFKRKKICHQT